MAVFTPITSTELDDLLANFELSPHLEVQGIASGTVNSNYKVRCQQGTFVLTILEATSHTKAQELASFADHCHQHGVPCPKLIHPSKPLSATFNDKPVILAQFLSGESVLTPSLEQCQHLGKVLAHLHTKGTSFPIKIENSMGNAWREQTFQGVKHSLSKDEQHALAHIIELQQRLAELPLPKGMVHYDLFRDNALFEDDHLIGIIDFYYACYETFVLDVAISINDWCTQWHKATPSLDLEKVNAMLKGYQAHRPLLKSEIEALPDYCKLVCGHFWLARLSTLNQEKVGQGHFEKDPTEFKKLYQGLNEQEPQLKAALAALKIT